MTIMLSILHRHLCFPVRRRKCRYGQYQKHYFNMLRPRRMLLHLFMRLILEIRFTDSTWYESVARPKSGSSFAAVVYLVLWLSFALGIHLPPSQVSSTFPKFVQLWRFWVLLTDQALIFAILVYTYLAGHVFNIQRPVHIIMWCPYVASMRSCLDCLHSTLMPCLASGYRHCCHGMCLPFHFLAM